MIFTGENKKAFEEWYKDIYFYASEMRKNYNNFTKLPFEMQSGVYLAYLDSVGVYIEIKIFCYSPDEWIVNIFWHDDNVGKSLTSHRDNGKLIWERYDLEKGLTVFPTRNEALKEAFKQADNLINKK